MIAQRDNKNRFAEVGDANEILIPIATNDPPKYEVVQRAIRRCVRLQMLDNGAMQLTVARGGQKSAANLDSFGEKPTSSIPPISPSAVSHSNRFSARNGILPSAKNRLYTT
ncbi:MAG: hypothetical protein ABR898_04615 [Terracidiphilus sp.]|jgi:hypothetical protein